MIWPVEYLYSSILYQSWYTKHQKNTSHLSQSIYYLDTFKSQSLFVRCAIYRVF